MTRIVRPQMSTDTVGWGRVSDSAVYRANSAAWTTA